MLLRGQFDLAHRPVFFPVVSNEVPPFRPQAVETAFLHCFLQHLQVQRYLRIGALIGQRGRGCEVIEVGRHE